VQKAICNEIGDAKFSISVDESRDESKEGANGTCYKAGTSHLQFLHFLHQPCHEIKKTRVGRSCYFYTQSSGSKLWRDNVCLRSCNTFCFPEAQRNKVQPDILCDTWKGNCEKKKGF
jgi:hypothetical protein